MISSYCALRSAKHRGFFRLRSAQNILRVVASRRTLYERNTRLSNNACSKPDGITGKVCGWLNKVQLSDVPAGIQVKVKHLILDGLACAIVGAKLPWSKTATQAVVEIEGTGHCTLFGWNKWLSPLNAALLNGTFIQGFELDDVHVHAPWHACSIILPALLAAVEHHTQQSTTGEKTSGASFLLATIVGFELGSRVGRALHGKEMLSRGWHSGAVFGPPAAAAAVSKLLDLSPSQTEDALGTACTQASGLMSVQYESMGKRMQHVFAARNGLFAALMSKAGYTGIDQVFERPYGGYLATFGQASKFDPPYLVEELVDGLGQDWRGIEGIRIKSHNSVVTTHAPIECIASLQAKYPERFSNLRAVRSILVEQAEPSWAHVGQDIERPLTVVGAQMSTKFIISVQLLDRVVLLDQFKETALERDDVWELAGKTECVWNPTFDQRGKWYTQVSVTFEDGEMVVEKMPASKTIASLLPDGKIRDKWRMLTDGILDGERRDDLEGAVLNLDRLVDVTDITRLLAGEVYSALD